MTSSSGFTSSTNQARNSNTRKSDLIACPLRHWSLGSFTDEDVETDDDLQWWLTFQKNRLSLVTGLLESQKEVFFISVDHDVISSLVSVIQRKLLTSSFNCEI